MKRELAIEQLSTLQDATVDLYNSLLTIVRQNAQGCPVGHDAIVTARAVLAKALDRSGKKIDWARERSI